MVSEGLGFHRVFLGFSHSFQFPRFFPICFPYFFASFEAQPTAGAKEMLRTIETVVDLSMASTRWLQRGDLVGWFSDFWAVGTLFGDVWELEVGDLFDTVWELFLVFLLCLSFVWVCWLFGSRSCLFDLVFQGYKEDLGVLGWGVFCGFWGVLKEF